jgi:hypothetical protein
MSAANDELSGLVLFSQAMIDEFDLDQDGEISIEVSADVALRRCSDRLRAASCRQEFIAIMTDGE